MPLLKAEGNRPMHTSIRLTLLAAAVAGALLADPPQTPTIAGVTADYSTTPATLTITGTNFGSTAPSVSLLGAPLTLVSFTAVSAVADIPAGTPPGSYTLSLVNNSAPPHDPASFDVTLGAA